MESGTAWLDAGPVAGHSRMSTDQELSRNFRIESSDRCTKCPRITQTHYFRTTDRVFEIFNAEAQNSFVTCLRQSKKFGSRKPNCGLNTFSSSVYALRVEDRFRFSSVLNVAVKPLVGTYDEPRTEAVTITAEIAVSNTNHR